MFHRTAIVGAIIAATVLGSAGTAAAAPAKLTDCGLVLENQTGECVSMLQTALNAEHPGYGLPVDGGFGPATRIALLDFQGRHHLPADGNAGPATLNELEPYASSAPSPPPAERPVEDSSRAAPSGSGVITNCGKITCSDYVSRAGTRQMLELMNSPDNPTQILSDTACAIGGGKKTSVCKLAKVAIKFGEAMTRRTLEDAVNNHPPNGACFKITYLKKVEVPTDVSTNNGDYCHDT